MVRRLIGLSQESRGVCARGKKSRRDFCGRASHGKRRKFRQENFREQKRGCATFPLQKMNRPLTEPTNEEPWRTCYAQLAPKLLLFARQWVGSVADAEDVVQTAFVKFWRHQPEAGSEHYPLLYSAVRTSALDLIRADSRRGRREQVVATDPDEPFFDPEIERNESAGLINSALQHLPESQREVLVLRIWGELSFAEIATALGDSINTVASRYRYALDGLRRILKPHEYQRA